MSGLTISSVSKTNDSKKNYLKFGQKYWDDSSKKSKPGYYFAYYNRLEDWVEIHKVIEVLTYENHPEEMKEWIVKLEKDCVAKQKKNPKNPILCLSEQLKKFTWEEWLRDGKGAPFACDYRQLATLSWTQQDLKRFIHFDFNILSTLDRKEIEHSEKGRKATEDKATQIHEKIIITDLEKIQGLRQKYIRINKTKIDQLNRQIDLLKQQLVSFDHEKEEIQKGLMDTILIEREMKMNLFISKDL
jgi:hypothetical protein